MLVPLLIHGSESWILNKSQKSKTTAMEMRILRKTEGVTDTKNNSEKVTELDAF